MIIGITGGTGCGKTTLLDVVRDLGGTVLDCDAIYHDLLKTDRDLLSRIEARFPGTVFNNVLDRKKLGSTVFADPQSLQALNQITHGAVKEKVLSLLVHQPKLAAIDAIGLFEGGLAHLCDVTVAVTAPMEDRITRLMARDNITREYALMRIQAQRPQEEFAVLCDRVLENNGTQAHFRQKCLSFLNGLDIL